MKKAMVVILTVILCLCAAFFAACEGPASRPTPGGTDDGHTEVPGDPADPDTPGNPGENPGTSGDPGDPGDPDDPGDPETPVDPGHSHTLAYVGAVPAQCETAGTKAYWRCETCGAKFLDEAAALPAEEDDLAVPALNHDFGPWTSEGKSGHSAGCSRCTEKESMPHMWRNNVCSVCGYAFPYTEGLEYELKGDYYAVTGGGGSCVGEITVPYTYNGLPVKEIAANAFSEERALTGIYMPGVTSVGEYAFYNCSALGYADGAVVIALGKSAFSGCALLTDAEFPSLGQAGTGSFPAVLLWPPSISRAWRTSRTPCFPRARRLRT